MKRVNPMNTDGVAFLILLGLLSFAFPNQGWSQVLETTEQHLERGRSYEERINLGRKAIADYQKEKANYGKSVGIFQSIFQSRSVTPQVEAMDRKYDALIAQEKAKVADLEKWAEWHKMRAKELEGY